VTPARPHIAIVGPSAGGKSELALRLAERLGDAEIVSVDSMCVYRHMDIGTAKPSPADRQRVPHHLIDVVDPDADFSVGEYQRLALLAIADIERRGHRAILVGGTGLYHRAVIDRLEIPGRWPSVRDDLDPDRDDPGDTRALHARLTELDPTSARRIEPTNRRRVVRALEVTIGSGRPFSSFGGGLEEYPHSEHLLVGLQIDRDRLAPRIDARVSEMMAAGFLAEVDALRHRFELSRTARQALGYRELLAHLDGGHREPGDVPAATDARLAGVVAEIGVRTRKFAVRQDRWFRRDPRIRWCRAEDPNLLEDVVSHVAEADRHSSGREIRVGGAPSDRYRDHTTPTTEAP